MTRSNYHVIAKVGGGWTLVRPDAARAMKNFDTKEEAVDYARTLTRKLEAELVIHGSDGRVVARESYAGDPTPKRPQAT